MFFFYYYLSGHLLKLLNLWSHRQKNWTTWLKLLSKVNPIEKEEGDVRLNRDGRFRFL